MTHPQFFQHPAGIVERGATIGQRTRVWAHSHILPGAIIGDDCNICDGVFIENDVVIGNRVTVKCGVQIWDGIRVEDDVFIGPNVTFTNDQFPRSRKRPVSYAKTTVKSGASIGANATILPGLFIGENAMIGAGAVVTRSVPAHAIVMGNPGRITGYVETERLSIDDAKQPSGNCSALTSKVRGVSFHRLTRHADMRGELVVANSPEQIPFSPVRMFIVFNVPTREVRGQHAHHKCHQYIMCTSGSVRVMVDDGVRREDFLLNQPDIGIYLPPLTWGEQFDYSADASLLVLASHPYDASDYIRDYHGFIKMVNGK